MDSSWVEDGSGNLLLEKLHLQAEALTEARILNRHKRQLA